MARHTKIVAGELIDNDDETGTKLAKKINDVVDGVTLVGLTAAQQGRHAAIIIVYDDA
ncbi:MAG: hypothetical protein NWF00_05300 [Candidatus Bathyarchaeota archaeon]|nr:hypothetical protein [Candidatus Bathyarchaeota archaeon]